MEAQDHLMARLNWEQGVNRVRESIRPGDVGNAVGRAQKAPNQLPFNVSLRKVGLPQRDTMGGAATLRSPGSAPLDNLPEECVSMARPGLLSAD